MIGASTPSAGGSSTSPSGHEDLSPLSVANDLTQATYSQRFGAKPTASSGASGDDDCEIEGSDDAWGERISTGERCLPTPKKEPEVPPSLRYLKNASGRMATLVTSIVESTFGVDEADVPSEYVALAKALEAAEKVQWQPPTDPEHILRLTNRNLDDRQRPSSGTFWPKTGRRIP